MLREVTGRKLHPGTRMMQPVLPKPNSLPHTPPAKSLTTMEDKELRKKLRNRQSALAARERKKARMLHLEQTVVQLQRSNDKLAEENVKLKQALGIYVRTISNVRGFRRSPEILEDDLHFPNLAKIKENDRGAEELFLNLNSTISTGYGGNISSSEHCRNDLAPIDYSMKSASKAACAMESPEKMVSPGRAIKTEDAFVDSQVNYAKRRKLKSANYRLAGTNANCFNEFSNREATNFHLQHNNSLQASSSEVFIPDVDKLEKYHIPDNRCVPLVKRTCSSVSSGNDFSRFSNTSDTTDAGSPPNEHIAQTLPSIDAVFISIKKPEKVGHENRTSGISHPNITPYSKNRWTSNHQTKNDSEMEDNCIQGVFTSTQLNADQQSSSVPTKSTIASNALSNDDLPRLLTSNYQKHGTECSSFANICNCVDSGVGVEEDTLDWLPEEAFLNFDY